MELKELMQKYGTEKVLCIENKYIPNTKINMMDFIETMSLRCFSQLRAEAEIDTNSRQIIPYVVIRKRIENVDYVYATTRLKGDSRLKGQVSIGTGGHIDISDIVMDKDFNFKINMYDTIENCIVRELQEETTLTNVKKWLFNNLELNDMFIDNRSEVSKVHLCLLFVLDLPCDVNIEIREVDKLEGEWICLEDVKNIKKLENWSEKAYELLCK